MFAKSFIRHSKGILNRGPKFISRFTSRDADYKTAPPVVGNAFPKSGAHLLIQILESLPGVTNYGAILNSMSLLYPYRESVLKLRLIYKECGIDHDLGEIEKIAPGEVLRAHFHYSPESARKLKEKNCVHYFMYRDLRDVAVSEAHYLTNITKMHRLRTYFRRRLSNDQERIMTAITGIEDPAEDVDYPNIAARFSRYIGWLEDESVCSVRFEDLVSGERKSVIAKMMRHYCGRVEREYEENEMVKRAVENINPDKSPTFRKGGAGDWRKEFTPEHKEKMKEIAGDMLIRLGYEKGSGW